MPITAQDQAQPHNAPERTSFPKDRIRVVLLEGVHQRGTDLLAREGFDIASVPGSPSPEDLRSLLADAHLVGVRSKTMLTEELIAGAPRLLGIGCFCIGTNQVDLGAARRLGIPVFNSPFSNTRSVAELTIAEAVCLMRRVFEKSSQMHAGKWFKSASGSREVRGRTLGIVGYGHIGAQVSVLAEAMGMRVIFYDVLPKLPLGNARPCGTLHELLAESDIVTLHVPSTPLTREMIGAKEIAQMRKGTHLINNARGEVVEVAALAEALRSGHLAGAALDVFPEEPRASGDPFDCELRGLDNVILTPHIGGSTLEAQEAIAEDVATKLVRFMNVGTTTAAVNVPQVELPMQESDAGRPHRVLHFHKNVPGVLGQIHAITTGLGVNISGEYLRTQDELGYVVLDVSPTDSAQLLTKLREIPETVRVRVLW